MNDKANDKDPQGKKVSGMGAGIGIGLALGAGIGVAMSNVGLGTPIGLCLGVAIGAALDKRNRKQQEIGRERPQKPGFSTQQGVHKYAHR